MAGRQTLTLSIEVRALVPQPVSFLQTDANLPHPALFTSLLFNLMR